MPERRFVVVASDTHTADLLVGIVPQDQRVTVLYLGAPSVELEALPADRVVFVPSLSSSMEAAVLGLGLRELIAPLDVVVLDSSQPSRDLAGWMSATLDLPVIWAVDALAVSEAGVITADRIVLGGSHRLVHEVAGGSGAIVMAKPTSSASDQDRPPRLAEVVEHRAEPAEGRVRVISGTSTPRVGAGLGAARIILSIGRGIGGPQHVDLYRELAERCGAALGASRVAVDSGWVPFAHQVGQTGTTVTADVYVAFGISGAIQHLAGMQTSKYIVAVNIDAGAPLCHVADLVVVADANEVAEILLKRLAEAGI